jgi:RNA polymerase subunit RPABC4/transcription elongation factor Spt4
MKNKTFNHRGHRGTRREDWETGTLPVIDTDWSEIAKIAKIAEIENQNQNRNQNRNL